MRKRYSSGYVLCTCVAWCALGFASEEAQSTKKACLKMLWMHLWLFFTAHNTQHFFTAGEKQISLLDKKQTGGTSVCTWVKKEYSPDQPSYMCHCRKRPWLTMAQRLCVSQHTSQSDAHLWDKTTMWDLNQFFFFELIYLNVSILLICLSLLSLCAFTKHGYGGERQTRPERTRERKGGQTCRQWSRLAPSKSGLQPLEWKSGGICGKVRQPSLPLFLMSQTARLCEFLRLYPKN